MAPPPAFPRKRRRRLRYGTTGYGVVTRAQPFPFQTPARPLPSVDLKGPSCPAATQAAADRQLTSLNRLALPLAGAGTLVAVQALPFHDAAAALPVLPPSLTLMST